MSIAFEGVSFSYEGAGGRLVLDDVNLTVYDGEFLGIAGHTGSGKSTLVQHMNGILHPTAGRIVACGVNLADRKAQAKVRGRIGVVFQYPEHQLFAATVAEDVAFGPRNLGVGADEIDARVDRALACAGLDPASVRDASPFELSGGQQRRVAFAGVLAMNPEVIVMDEPAAGLDPQGREELLDLISSLHDEGLTVVMVSPLDERPGETMRPHRRDVRGFRLHARLARRGVLPRGRAARHRPRRAAGPKSSHRACAPAARSCPAAFTRWTRSLRTSHAATA